MARDWAAEYARPDTSERGLQDRFKAWQQQLETTAGPPVLGSPYGVGRAVSGALGMVVDPILDIVGPQAPLTEKVFGGEDNALTRVADVALKVAPLAIGVGIGGLAAKAAGRLAGTALADMGVGALSGIAGAGAESIVRQTELVPALILGGAFGTGGGAIVNKLSKPGRDLARQFAARPSANKIPDIDELDATIPHVPVESLEIAARRRAEVRSRATTAARKAYREIVPKDIEPHPAIKRLARKEAAAAARAVRSDLSLEAEGNAINQLFSSAVRKTGIDDILGALQRVQGVWVTRLAVTLSRDRAAFKSVGREFADKILRTEELKGHMEGRLVTNVWRPLWKDVPKHEEHLVDGFLHGEGGRLSNAGLAAAGRWREIDDALFDQSSRIGLLEEVSPEHAAAQRIAATTGQEPPQLVPLQYKTNHVPYYIDREKLGALARPGKERTAYLQKLVRDGEADNMSEAQRLLEEVLETPHGGTQLHVRSPFQHERQLALQLPRERNAKVWSRRAFHDHARRLSQAKVWGPQDEVFYDMKRRLAAEGGDADRLDKLFRTYVGRPPKGTGTEFAAAGRAARTLSAVTLLGPRVGMLQYLQLSNTGARLGIRNTLEGLVAGWRNPDLRQAAEEVGALLPSEHLLTTTEPVTKMGEWWVKHFTQMQRADRGVRGISTLAGGLAAKRWAGEYWRLLQADAAAGSPSLARTGIAGRALVASGIRNRADRMGILRRRLEETLGIPIKRVIASEGELPFETIQAGMQNASNKTQFASTMLDLPEARSTTGLGRFIFTLRHFVKQQTPFVTKMVSDAVKYGDTGPIVRYLALYPTLYAAARPYLDFVAGREQVDMADATTMERVTAALEGALWTGIFGGMGDFFNQLSSRDPARRLAFSAMGAPIAQGLEVGGAAAGAITTGSWDQFYNALYKNLTPSPVKAVIQHANR